MSPPLTVAVVIVAAGRGARASSSGLLLKQYARIGGEPVLARTTRRFVEYPGVAWIQIVIHPEDEAAYQAACGSLGPVVLEPVTGGATRQQSVHRGLEALTSYRPDAVLIHDAARPFVDGALIERVIGGLATAVGSIPALAVSDTLKRTTPDGIVTGTVDRVGLWRAQTPQGFAFASILGAHRAAAAAGRGDFTDDAALAEWHGLPVRIVEGAERNCKITTAEDLAMADRELSAAPSSAHLPDVRTGTGFDVHRLVPGDHIWLGGVRIAHTHRLEGHSDADVVLHAVTDALLGAIGDGDIGLHFPPSDTRWKGAPSHLFLAEAARRVGERGGRISNVDLTVMCEAPRIGAYRDQMRHAIAAILGIEPARVGVKATTTEGLGFTGRREGIAAMATATVVLG